MPYCLGFVAEQPHTKYRISLEHSIDFKVISSHIHKEMMTTFCFVVLSFISLDFLKMAILMLI